MRGLIIGLLLASPFWIAVVMVADRLLK